MPKTLIIEIDIDEKPGGPNMELLALVWSPSKVPEDRLLRTLEYRLQDEEHHIRLRWK